MICVSLANLNFKEVMDILPSIELAEIRMDLLDFTDDQFAKVFSTSTKTVATFRPKEGVTEVQRAEMLIQAVKNGAGYVDIEYESSPDFKNAIVPSTNVLNCDVIVSYHDFEKTPTLPELKSIVKQSVDMGADVVKIATMAKNVKDNIRIFSLFEEKERLIAFCMGDMGKISRIVSPFLGAEFTFASFGEEMAVAPGQVSHDVMNEIINSIKQS